MCFADHFPDAFYGQNNKIRETLNNLILHSPQEWQTGVGLPFVKIDGTVRSRHWPSLSVHTPTRARLLYRPLSGTNCALMCVFFSVFLVRSRLSPHPRPCIAPPLLTRAFVLRRRGYLPYADLGVHHAMLASRIMCRAPPMHSPRVPCLRCSFAGVTVTASFGALRHPPVTVKTFVSSSRVLAQSRHRHDHRIGLLRHRRRSPALLGPAHVSHQYTTSTPYASSNVLCVAFF